MSKRVEEILAEMKSTIDHLAAKAHAQDLHLDRPMALEMHELKLAVWQSALFQAELIVALAQAPLITSIIPDGPGEPRPGSITYRG